MYTWHHITGMDSMESAQESGDRVEEYDQIEEYNRIDWVKNMAVMF